VNEGLTDDEITKLDNLTQTSFKTSATNFTNAKLDAEINFSKAMRIIERERSGKQTVNLKGDNPKGTGIGSPQKVQEKEIQVPKLDPHAESFLNWVKGKSEKWTDEKVADTLKGETPLKFKK